MKTKHAIRDKKIDISVDQDLITSSKLILQEDEDSDMDSFLSAEDEIEVRKHVSKTW